VAVIGDAYIVVRAITSGFENDVRRGVRGIDLKGDGKSVAGSFARGFSSGIGDDLGGSFAKFRKEAEAARVQFQSLVRTSFTLTAALGPLIAGIGSLATGFVSLVSILGAATPSLVVLPGILTAVGLAAAGTAAAFSGVGKAVSAGLQNASKAAVDNSAAIVAANRRVEDAQERLDKLRNVDSPRAARDALRRQQEAEENLRNTIIEARRDEEEALENIEEVRARNAELAEEAAQRIADAEADASATALDAARNEEEAIKRLSRVKEENTERLIEANRRLEEAQNDLTKALEKGREEVQQLGFDAESAAISEKKAAIDLEKARETLLRTQDLAPNTRARREAQLAFAEAELNLRRAKDKNADLAKEQNRIAGDPTRTQGYIDAAERQEEAENNVAKTARDAARAQIDAENNLVQVKEQNAARIAEADRRVSEARLAAAKANGEAAQREAEAAQKLVDILVGNDLKIEESSKKLALVMEDNAEKMADMNARIADAEKDLARAIEDKDKAIDGGAAGIDAYRQALENLSPEAQKFVKFMVEEFIPATKKLRNAIASTLLPAIQEGLGTLIDKLFPKLEPMLKKFGTSLGKAFNTIIASVVDPENIGDIGKVFDTSGAVVEGLGTTIANVFDSILSILVAADPIIRKFTSFLAAKTGQFAEFLDTKEASGELEEFFNKSGEIAAETGEVLGNAFSSLVNIIKANFSEGGGGYILLQYLKDVTAEFEKFSGSEEGQKKLSKFFADSAENVKSILGFFGQLFKAILVAGADPGVGKFFDILKEAMPTFEAILREAVKAGPSLAEFIKSVLEFTKLTMESGAITTFFNTLRTALDAVNKVLENDIVMAILKVTGKVFAFLSALGLISKVGGFAFKVLSGNLLRGLALFGKVLKVVTLLGGAILKLSGFIVGKLLVGLRLLGVFFLTNPIGLFITVVAGLVALFVVLYNKNENFRKAAQEAFEKVKNAAEAAFNWLKENWPLVLAILTGPIGLAVLAITKNWDTIVAFVKGVPQKLKDAAVGMWTWVTDRLSAMWEKGKEVFGTIVEWVKGVPGKLKNGVVGMWTWVTDRLSSMFEGIKTKWNEIIGWIKGLPARIREGAGNLWDGFKESFRTALNWIISKWNGFRISARIPSNTITNALNIAGKGFDLDTPNIPLLAEGGTIQPSPGGTLARIAEAGRPERVEPLDPDGLSKRDKAMIQLLTGGKSGGNVFNIYPSEGMNESELASMISRQIAFQLRRGGA
jgi:phage-related protein